MRRFITMDETWIYHETETLQWIEAGSSAPKQVKSERSAKKIMASIFWDAKGVLLIDYLEKGKTINSEYYCNLLDQLDKNIREKRPGLQKKTIIFHQDNARVHTSFLTMVKLNELKYELFEHPPYSPDLAPSDYYLFRNLKQFLRGKRFSSNEEAIAAVEQYFAELPENHYRDGNYWRIVGISVFKLREIILNKKNNFIKKYTFFHFCFQNFSTNLIYKNASKISTSQFLDFSLFRYIFVSKCLLILLK